MNAVTNRPLSADKAVIPHGTWCVFLAMFETGEKALIRVGTGTNPITRIAELFVESPFPIVGARIAGAADRGQAKRIEGRFLRSVGEMQKATRGHWFEVDPDNLVHKNRISNGFNLLYKIETGHDPSWQTVSAETIKQAARLLGKKAD